MQLSTPNFIVGIGGSAGGLDAYKALLNALPSNTGMAFVIISHIWPAYNSLLAEILSRHTKMRVLNASAEMRVHADHVYVLTANTDLTIEGDMLKVVSPRSASNAQIDIFFTSLAIAKQGRAIGVVLSGYDGDGALGCRRIKENGGTTFAQDNGAEVHNMPQAAQATGCVDFVMSPRAIAAALARLSIAATKKARHGVPGAGRK